MAAVNAATASERKCGVCGDHSNAACSGCKKVFYCGPAHQRQDWPSHKQVCGQLAAAAAASPAVELPAAAAAAVAERTRTPPISPDDATALGKELLAAIKAKNVPECLRLVGAGADLAVRDKDGDTALLLACMWSPPEVSLAIMECPGVEIDARNRYEDTPLMLASGSGLAPVVAALLSKRADINAVDKYGQTALYWACDWSHAATALHLIEAGANVNKGKYKPLSHPNVNAPPMAAVKAALLARGAVVAVGSARRNSRRNGRTSRRNRSNRRNRRNNRKQTRRN